MEVSFDTEKHNGTGAPVTRIYAPSHRNGPEVRMVEEVAENLPVYPQPRENDIEAEQAIEVEKPKVPIYSRILMILAVFLIAGTAIIAISGSAQIAKIYTEIHALDSEISSYKEKISLLRKEQSMLNDYTTINEANQNAGRVMSWNDH
jgi:cell division protein FtsL